MDNLQPNLFSQTSEQNNPSADSDIFELINQILEKKFLNFNKETFPKHLTNCFPFLQYNLQTVITVNLFYQGVKIDLPVFEAFNPPSFPDNNERRHPDDFQDNSYGFQPIFLDTSPPTVQPQSNKTQQTNTNKNAPLINSATYPTQAIIEPYQIIHNSSIGINKEADSNLNEQSPLNAISNIQPPSNKQLEMDADCLTVSLPKKHPLLSLFELKPDSEIDSDNFLDFQDQNSNQPRKNKQFSLSLLLNERKRNFLKVYSQDEIKQRILNTFTKSKEVLDVMQRNHFKKRDKPKPDLVNPVLLTKNPSDSVSNHINLLKEHWNKKPNKFSVYLFKKSISLQTNSNTKISFDEIDLSKKWLGTKRVKYS